MVKRTASAPDTEPETFSMPSEKEHLFEVTGVDVIDDNTVSVLCVVHAGIERGAKLQTRMTLDDNAKGFFATRKFLKACQLPYKGDIDIDTDTWYGCKFFADVVHVESTKPPKPGFENRPPLKFANIRDYNYEKTFCYEPEAAGHVVEKEWDA